MQKDVRQTRCNSTKVQVRTLRYDTKFCNLHLLSVAILDVELPFGMSNDVEFDSGGGYWYIQHYGGAHKRSLVDATDHATCAGGASPGSTRMVGQANCWATCRLSQRCQTDSGDGSSILCDSCPRQTGYI